MSDSYLKTLDNLRHIVVTRDDGTKVWYMNGTIHRSNDEPAIVHSNGVMEWWENGIPHRENSPAVLYPDGSEEWRKNGKRHRENGPAIIHRSTGVEEFYIEGKRISKRTISYYSGTPCHNKS